MVLILKMMNDDQEFKYWNIGIRNSDFCLSFIFIFFEGLNCKTYAVTVLFVIVICDYCYDLNFGLFEDI